MYLGDIDPTAPFAVPKTTVQKGLTEIQQSIWAGIGFSIGAAMAGFVWWVFFGKKG